MFQNIQRRTVYAADVNIIEWAVPAALHAWPNGSQVQGKWSYAGGHPGHAA
jgi:hypothetical protein